MQAKIRLFNNLFYFNRKNQLVNIYYKQVIQICSTIISIIKGNFVQTQISNWWIKKPMADYLRKQILN